MTCFNKLKWLFTDQHNSDELLFAREDVALFLHTLTDGFGYEPNTLDQTEFHSQVLKWGKTHKSTSTKHRETQKTYKRINERTHTDQKIQVKMKSRLNMKNWIIAFSKLSGMQTTRRPAAPSADATLQVTEHKQKQSKIIPAIYKSINHSNQSNSDIVDWSSMPMDGEKFEIRVVWLEEISSTANHLQALV